MTAFEMVPIGRVRGGRDVPEDDGWGGERARIELDFNVVDRDATQGLGNFSHVEVLFVFHLVDPDRVCRGARHPRGRRDRPLTGILAQRAKDRPNRLGSTVCALVAVGQTHIDVAGLDAVDGTPVLDVKPYMKGFGPRGSVTEPAWADELMERYW